MVRSTAHLSFSVLMNRSEVSVMNRSEVSVSIKKQRGVEGLG